MGSRLRALVVLLLWACRPTPSTPPWRTLPSAAAALEQVLATDPRVLGVGELHARVGSPPVPSSMSWFTRDLLPVLAPRTTDLVLETWRLDGACGEVEVALDAAVAADTARAEDTPTELVALARRAKALGVQPHALRLSCADQAAIRNDGDVRYDLLLTTLGRELGALARQGLERPEARVVVYGGAVHNDRAPPEATAAYSYGAPLAAAAGSGYVELDLYVPELLAAWPDHVEPAWAGAVAEVGPEHVVLVTRGPGSFVLLLPTQAP